jgi:hypothetical protein
MTLYALAIDYDGPNPTLIQENGQRLPTQLVIVPSGGNFGPLARTRWIDGNTAVPSVQQTGTEGAPYSSPEVFLNTLEPQPASLDDAQTSWVGLISPTATDVWTEPQNWTIPPGRSVVIRNLTPPGIVASAGHLAVPPPECASFTAAITWTNTETTNPAFNPPSSVLTLDNITLLAGSTLVLTDGAGAAPSALVLSGIDGFYDAAVNVSGASNFKLISVINATANLAMTGTAFALQVTGGTWSAAGLSCTSIFADNASIADTGANLTTTGAQSYIGCNINANGLKTTGASAMTFEDCVFARAVAITATTAGAIVTFDGPSWSSFLSNGGTVAAGTVVVVTGGFLQGVVPGANIASPGGAAASLSINGTGATAAFASGGNWYTVTTLAANTTITLLDTGGAVAGTTLAITRTDASAFSLTVADAGTGNLVTIASGLGDVILRFNGTNWKLVEVTGASGQNGETTVYVSGSTAIGGFTNVGVNTQAGAFTVTLNAGGALGSTYEIFDAGSPMNAAANPITYTPASGAASVEDYRVPGAYQAAGASGQINVNGGSIRLRFDGTNKFKAVAKV